ncbi:MAG: hypothetical protein MZV63_65135 [Marinilabiliales bacterium]|nr:hypothetical protein [Marinilabiliales bacterium]
MAIQARAKGIEVRTAFPPRAGRRRRRRVPGSSRSSSTSSSTPSRPWRAAGA